MHRTVIDIETVAQPLEAFDARFHDDLIRWFDPGPASEPVTEARREEAAARLSLWGATGRVIVIGMHNPDTGSSRILADDDEKALLAEFWDLVKPFDLHITFNGKNFDFPFLQMRSAAQQVKPTVKLDTRRYSMRPHYDLREILSHFYSRRHGSLDFFCSLFGIPSPKGEMTGAGVGEAYRQGRLQEIAQYCQADVEATAALYARVVDYF